MLTAEQRYFQRDRNGLTAPLSASPAPGSPPARPRAPPALCILGRATSPGTSTRTGTGTRPNIPGPWSSTRADAFPPARRDRSTPDRTTTSTRRGAPAFGPNSRHVVA